MSSLVASSLRKVTYLPVRQYGLSAATVAAQLGISPRSVARAFERAQQLGVDSERELNGPRLLR